MLTVRRLYVERSLHPNLARVAAEYDEVLLAFQQGRIAPNEARRRIMALVARDDNGLEWSIDAETGKWRYRTHFGSFALGDPPAYGVLAPTPHDLGSGTGLPSDDRVALQQVDMVALTSEGSLTGSTLLPQIGDMPPATASRRSLIAAVCIVAGVAMIVTLAVGLLGR